MKRVQVIGSGNAFNSDGRAHACYLLENRAGAQMLLDCGATSLYRLQQLKIDLLKIDQLALTHFHGDHFGGLPFLLIEYDIVRARRTPFTILGPPGVQAACEALIELCYPQFKFHFPILYREIPPDGVESGGFFLKPYPVTHKAESVGYRISDGGAVFAFSGDASFDENLFALTDGVDLAIVELSMEDQTDPPVAHVALSEILARPEALGAKRLVFTHIYNDLAAKARASGLGEVAEDGSEYWF